MSNATELTPALAHQPVVTPTDRFGLTLCLAIITHAVVVLGVTFTNEIELPPDYDAMEIILVQQSSQVPDDAKLLSQANLEGGGDVDDEVTPATPLPSPFPDNVAELSAPPESDPASQASSDNNSEVLTAESGETDLPTDPENSIREENQPESETAEITRPKTLPSATTLLTNSMKIAALSAEIERKLVTRSQRPRRKYISASTREFLYAAYMEAWRAKVERIGNLNYPDAARRQRLSGNLILDVALNKDGSINDIVIRRSSGHKALDDAAIRIVELASPYSEFPEDIATQTDILHITRTWQFLNNGSFR
ncbi:MAG: energy transducer TonB [Gammaproteobacteria bacterium]|nr:energy transducer TonB [Gammaproteobacteria bacterium]